MARIVSGTFTEDGNSSELVVSSPEFSTMGVFVWLGSDAGVSFGGGTVTVQMKNAGGTFVNIPLASYVSVTAQQILVPNNAVVRLSISGSTTPDLDYEIMCMSLK